jgi:hypothetical protein
VRRSADDENVLVFSVERSVKGRLADEIAVRDEHPRSSVELRPAEGERIGLLLRRTADQYSANACSFADPDALLRAAESDRTPPQVRLRVPGRHSLADGRSFAVVAELDELSRISVRARLVAAGRTVDAAVKFRQGSPTGSRTEPVEITVGIRAHARRAIRTALRNGHRARLVLRVAGRDAAGNVRRVRHVVELAGR